jgi:hypothetical protein
MAYGTLCPEAIVTASHRPTAHAVGGVQVIPQPPQLPLSVCSSKQDPAHWL